ncbi:hypothetical protein OEZ85_013173 [Tetradesmus obliquus]|uniref:Phosphatidic acid phosphatase type 2/haloperoxidase domain-containing protein n=1 Tax=Tetradesmus obliquus TaxID=3088 RepID=A0ABY8U776_TETOB|nr:hypothetical protein OEZ85_013173 [Tetradesmus obliquus]
MSPRMRPVFQPDATIGYPTVGDHDMPFVVALLVPFVVLVLTALAVECLWFHHGCQRRTITLINLLLTFMAAVAVVGFMTELFKRLAGRLRPDFLSRCQNADNMDAINANTGLPGLQLQTGCTNMDIKALEDGRMSFPSGHSSCSMAVGLYAAIYMLWSLHWREGGALHRALLRPASSIMGRIGKDVASLVVLLVLLFQIAWPWGVALSRFIDNRHNASDIVGGVLLAVSFVPVFVARLASSVSYQGESGEWITQEQAEQEQREQEQQLLEQEEQPRMQQHVHPPVMSHPLAVQAPASTKHAVPHHAVIAMQKAATEKSEVQLTINSAPSQDSDAVSAAASSHQAASDLPGQAQPAVTSATDNV